MEFASEMIIKAALLNERVAQVPVTLWPDQRGRAHICALGATVGDTCATC